MIPAVVESMPWGTLLLALWPVWLVLAGATVCWWVDR